MDTKVIAMVGAVIVVGAAVYGVATGTVLPGTEDIGNNESVDSGDDNIDTPAVTDNGESNDEEEENDSDENNVVDEQEENVTTPVEQEPVEEPLNDICEKRESDLSAEDLRNRKIAVGPPFDPLLFESMLHDSINKLRDMRSDADPLNCDPELRDIAREHSELVVKSEDEEYEKEVEINETAVRYEGVCENPRERHGTWYYQRDMELNSPDGSSDQRVVIIENHEDLVRDVRGAWGENDEFISDVTDSRMTRQGIGAYINRDTRRVVVTQVLCGEENTEEADGTE